LIKTTSRLSPIGKVGVWLLIIGALAGPFVAAWAFAGLAVYSATGYDFAVLPWLQIGLLALSILVFIGGFVMMWTEKEFSHEVTVLSDE
jgi:hypothetical protein